MPGQLTTSRIGNLTRLIITLAICDDHAYVYTVFGKLEGAVRGGRGGKEKEWTDCVQGDIRAFDTTGDWKATALKVEVWVETVAEGGRRFVAAWRK